MGPGLGAVGGDKKEAPKGGVKRGEYLVNTVARCGDCHTPRDDKGKLGMSRHLQGAAMWFTPKARRGEFEDHAPDITMSGKAGKWSETKMTHFFASGERSDPPMPAYKLTVEDAAAVTAYLRSLPGRKAGKKAEPRGEEGRREKRKEKRRDDD